MPHAGRVAYTAANLGLNYAWLNKHDGNEVTAFLGDAYDQAKVHADIDGMAALGMTQIRIWAPMEAVYSYTGSAFVENATYTGNLDDLLAYAATKGIVVALVMGDFMAQTAPTDLDGKFRWDLAKTAGGRAIMQAALETYVDRFKAHPNILMWEVANEPYACGVGGFSPYATNLSITVADVHAYLLQMYAAVKALDSSRYVGFSEYEEEEQEQYRPYSDATFRATYIDDCTDVYAPHIYRGLQSQVWDGYPTLTGKPLWLLEVGHYNFTGTNAGVTGANELFDPIKNANATRDLMRKCADLGFSLMMPWSWSDGSMVLSNADGSHTPTDLTQWMKNQLAARLASGVRASA